MPLLPSALIFLSSAKEHRTTIPRRSSITSTIPVRKGRGFWGSRLEAWKNPPGICWRVSRLGDGLRDGASRPIFYQVAREIVISELTGLNSRPLRGVCFTAQIQRRSGGSRNVSRSGRRSAQDRNPRLISAHPHRTSGNVSWSNVSTVSEVKVVEQDLSVWEDAR